MQFRFESSVCNYVENVGIGVLIDCLVRFGIGLANMEFLSKSKRIRR